MDVRDLLDELRFWRPSRKTWVWVGDGVQWLCAVGAFWYLSRHGVTLAASALTLVACLVCQAGAVAAVVWPGATAGTHRLADLHQGVTVAVLCLTLIFGAIPVAIIVGRNHDESSVAALFVAGGALMLTSIAGLVAVTELTHHIGSGNGREMPEEPHLIDVSDAGSADD